MIPAMIIIALMTMPYEPVTSPVDWYAPVQIEYIDAEPTEEDIEHIWTLEGPNG